MADINDHMDLDDSSKKNTRRYNKTIDVYLQYQRNAFKVVGVFIEDIEEAQIIKHQGEYFVFSSKDSKPTKPVFVLAQMFEIVE